MGSCEGLQILGVLRTAQEGRQMVLQLKPSSGIRWEHCSFCNTKCWDAETNELQSGEIHHSHEIKGIFSFIPSENQWTLTFGDCNNEEEEQQHETMKEPTSASENVKNNVSQQKKIPSSLQYEVDGKVYELRSSLPPSKKTKNVDSLNMSNSFITPNQPLQLQAKAIEFVIEDKKYSTSSVNAKSFEETHDTVDETSTLEASLELLQVGELLYLLRILMPHGIVYAHLCTTGENVGQMYYSRPDHLWTRHI